MLALDRFCRTFEFFRLFLTVLIFSHSLDPFLLIVLFCSNTRIAFFIIFPPNACFPNSELVWLCGGLGVFVHCKVSAFFHDIKRSNTQHVLRWKSCEGTYVYQCSPQESDKEIPRLKTQPALADPFARYQEAGLFSGPKYIHKVGTRNSQSYPLQTMFQPNKCERNSDSETLRGSYFPYFGIGPRILVEDVSQKKWKEGNRAPQCFSNFAIGEIRGIRDLLSVFEAKRLRHWEGPYFLIFWDWKQMYFHIGWLNRVWGEY